MQTPYRIPAMTRSQLLKLREKVNAERSALCDELIAAGRGHERHSETVTKTDELSLRYIASHKIGAAIHDECKRRTEYHGTLHRIKAGTA